MADAVLDGLQLLLNPQSLFFLTVGMVIGLVIGFLPGLGGLATLALLTPFIIGMPADDGLAFILGAYGAVSFGGSITAIIANTPGTGEQVVTAFDGYPMARQGKAARALGVSAAASAFGGMFGVVVLILAIPVALQVVVFLRPPEVFLLGMIGVLLIGVSGASTITKGIASGALGLMLSFIGLDPVTGVSRMTFGQLELQEGLGITAVTMGLFALTEMFILFSRGTPIAGTTPLSRTREKGARLVDGLMDVVRGWRRVIECGSLGALSGMIPGMGGSVAMFGAYAYVKHRSPDPDSFGRGNPMGVLGPEAANNAKEGGSFVPTLTLGIPGSSGMALMLGILLILGYSPGPDLIQDDLDIVFLIAWIVALSNILASVLGLAMVPLFTRMTFLRPQILAPSLIAIALIGSFVETRLMLGVAIAVAAGLLGYVMRAAGYSAAGFILGFVLGPIIDRNLNLALQAYGPEFVFRPVSATIIVAVVVFVVLGRIGRRRSQARTAALEAEMSAAARRREGEES